jgi:hypothetical protein
MTRDAHRRLRLALAVVAALALLGLHVCGLGTGLLFLAPAFVLGLPLLAGRYPGEAVLAQVRRPRSRPRSRHRLALTVRPPARLLPRGGLLVGHALAGRAPPGWVG